MGKIPIWGVVFILLLLFNAGCNKMDIEDDNNKSVDEREVAQYVNSKGYKIISFKGLIHKYNLDKSKLMENAESTQYRQAWSVQKVAPENYIGKEISVYASTVSNHPLENKYNVKINVYIMMSDGKVVGGYSFPDIAGMVGSYYSLEGKTMEEVTGMSYKEWNEKWNAKYGN
ncbi:hypothetical protein [Paenibacillus naphthalenovorans]|uniref:hypothetical protein n=1 Tax=Paenibacillus naphthalenovorans TaxID=162209 RepID=UPI00088467C5|nr:hypothetical protein [Paenibacillus naphthalenovorans]SDJ86934.1 hypothetical protein SAMN05421868_15114 [Paenibacillus naphthalenovorans]